MRAPEALTGTIQQVQIRAAGPNSLAGEIASHPDRRADKERPEPRKGDGGGSSREDARP